MIKYPQLVVACALLWVTGQLTAQPSLFNARGTRSDLESDEQQSRDEEIAISFTENKRKSRYLLPDEDTLFLENLYKRRIFNFTQLVLLNGQSVSDLETTMDLGIQHTIGYSIHPLFQPGLSVFYFPYEGLEAWGIMGSIQGVFPKSLPLMPGYFVRYGTSGAETPEQQGFNPSTADGKGIWQVGADFRIPLKYPVGLVLEIGYQRHAVTIITNNFGPQTITNRNLNRVIFSFAFQY